MIQSQGEIATNGWVRADWDTYIDAIESSGDEKYNGYYYEGRMRIEDMQKGADHARLHALTSFAINLFCIAREIPINGLINCSYRKPGIMECQPDLSYYSQDLAQIAPQGVSVVNLDEQSAPNLVIEISNITLADDLGAKRRLYEEMGVAEYWIVVAQYWIIDVPNVKIYAFNMADRSSQALDVSLAIPNLSIDTITTALNLSKEQDQSQIGQWLMSEFNK
jgi:Uma2 family endonuclease